MFAFSRAKDYDLVAFGDCIFDNDFDVGKGNSPAIGSTLKGFHKNQVINPKDTHSSIRMFKTVASPRSISDITLSETVPTLRTNLWCDKDRI